MGQLISAHFSYESNEDTHTGIENFLCSALGLDGREQIAFSTTGNPVAYAPYTVIPSSAPGEISFFAVYRGNRKLFDFQVEN
jgi:hypothetical protein